MTIYRALALMSYHTFADTVQLTVKPKISCLDVDSFVVSHCFMRETHPTRLRNVPRKKFGHKPGVKLRGVASCSNGWFFLSKIAAEIPLTKAESGMPCH